MSILVNAIQTMGAVDGPGLRVVVFLQGCNLRCQYCHNPETWEETGGEAFTASRLCKEILRYRSYFLRGGGVTFSGGEPLLQEQALLPLFRQLKKEKIHIALDTNGSVLTENTKKLIAFTDLVLLDVKMTENSCYEKYAQMSYDQVILFLKQVQKQKKTLWLRQVVLEGINDSKEQLLRFKALKEQYSMVEKIELLPFRKLCLEKYEALNLTFPLAAHPQTNPAKLKELEKNL